jgi:hypothetical protein
MKTSVRLLSLFAAGFLLAGPLAFAQNENQGEGSAIITVLPKNSKDAAPDISQQTIHVEVNGKQSQITGWQPLRGANAPVEVVLLVDDGARESLGREFDDITQFIRSLPPNVRFTIGYMENGRAALAGPFSTDRAKAAQELHLPLGLAGESASPYFCLSDLAKRWPSNDLSARREVILITDGVDYYHPQYDPEDPYVQDAMRDSVQAHLVVYSIYWRNTGRFDRTRYANDAGQNLLLEVTAATGGNSYWEGFGNPVSLSPFFEDFGLRLKNQYELGFQAPLRGKPELADLKVKISAPGAKITAPQQTWVGSGGVAQQ